jgi:23S rRNA (guanine2535-N1)-methyltransferase
MHYQFAKAQLDYSDLSSGRVFYGLPGHPAFPIRLASEIFQRCIALRTAEHLPTPCVLFDPCCGGAYHLSVLAYLHREYIREVIGSDVEEEAIALAQRNLDLLSVSGLDRRISEITEMLKRYGKKSHHEALKSATVMRQSVAFREQKYPLKISTFLANATDGKALRHNLKGVEVDIVLTDIPYGRSSRWVKSGSELSPSDPLYSMLTALLAILSPISIVAIISDKQQKIKHQNYERLEQFQVGKRRVGILRPLLS